MKITPLQSIRHSFIVSNSTREILLCKLLHSKRGLGKKVLPVLAVLLVAAGMKQNAEAAVIYYQGFEATAPANAWAYTTSGVAAVSTNVGSADYPANSRIQSGSGSLQVNNGTGSVTFSNVDISSYQALYDQLSITVRLSATSTGPANGLDGPDTVRLFTSINGAAYSTTADISLAGAANARWTYDATKSATTNAGTPLSVTATAGGSEANYSTFNVILPSSALLAGLKIDLINDNAGEFWNIDSISLNGTLAAPEPSRVLLLMVGFCGAIFHRRRKL